MVMTLQAGLIDVVKATLLGSVLSNLLLVLGCSFFFGGIVHHAGNKAQDKPFEQLQGEETQGSDGEMAFVGEKVQTFSVMSAMVNTSLLLLSCLSLSLVTVFYSETHSGDIVKHARSLGMKVSNADNVVLEVSRTCAIAMMMSYVAYIFFQLVTHREAMTEDEGGGDDEEEPPMLSINAAISTMLATTTIVAYSSEMLVNSLEEVVETLGISSHFIGIILLPIVGNACEHASAIRFAIQDKPSLSIGIAVGSSTQIALFVVPFSVLYGWAMDVHMDLNFGSLNTTVLCLSVIVVLSIVVDGSATWLQGYLLVSAYLVIAVLYWHLPDKIKAEV